MTMCGNNVHYIMGCVIFMCPPPEDVSVVGTRVGLLI